VVQPDPLLQAAVAADVVQQAYRLPGVAAPLVAVSLEVVQLLQHPEGEHDLVVPERQDGVRAVADEVGVDDEGLDSIAHRGSPPLPTIAVSSIIR